MDAQGSVVLPYLPAAGDEPPFGRNREIPSDPLDFISVNDLMQQFEKRQGPKCIDIDSVE
jgi:hypothetical protein